jgi:hypothetical protein
MISSSQATINKAFTHKIISQNSNNSWQFMVIHGSSIIHENSMTIATMPILMIQHNLCILVMPTPDIKGPK